MIYTATGRETLSNPSSSTALTSGNIGVNVVYAVIQALKGDVRYTVESTAPVAGTTGHVLAEGDAVEVWGQKALKAFRVINDTGMTADVEVTYFGTAV